jgi:hypothetical protein
MSYAIDQAEDLRKRAVEILLTERAAIDEHLAMLSYDGGEAASAASSKRRVCTVCGSADHNARRCPKKGAPSPPPPRRKYHSPNSPFFSIHRAPTLTEYDPFRPVPDS